MYDQIILALSTLQQPITHAENIFLLLLTLLMQTIQTATFLQIL